MVSTDTERLDRLVVSVIKSVGSRKSTYGQSQWKWNDNYNQHIRKGNRRHTSLLVFGIFCYVCVIKRERERVKRPKLCNAKKISEVKQQP